LGHSLSCEPFARYGGAFNGRQPQSQAQLIKGIIERWPDPITATFKMEGKFNNFPRLPYQFADFTLLVTRYLLQLPTKLQSQR
jgi:hypothetical protein